MNKNKFGLSKKKKSILFVYLLVCLFVAIFFLIPTTSDFIKVLNSNKWLPIKGSLNWITCKTLYNPVSFWEYRAVWNKLDFLNLLFHFLYPYNIKVRTQYTYIIDNKKYLGNIFTYGFKPGLGTTIEKNNISVTTKLIAENLCRTILGKYKKGENLIIYFNPQKKAESLIQKGIFGGFNRVDNLLGTILTVTTIIFFTSASLTFVILLKEWKKG